MPSETALQRWTESMPAGKTVRFQLCAAPQYNDIRLIADLYDYLGRVDDAELAALADPILHPPPYVHPVLGRFDAIVEIPKVFEGKVEWRGRRVGLTLDPGRNGTLDDCAATMIELLAHADRWQAMVGVGIYDHLYDLWDSTWREEGKPSLLRGDWLAHLRLMSISVSEDKHVTFEYHDGDLFWGHHISAFGSLEGGLIGASI